MKAKEEEEGRTRGEGVWVGEKGRWQVVGKKRHRRMASRGWEWGARGESNLTQSTERCNDVHGNKGGETQRAPERSHENAPVRQSHGGRLRRIEETGNHVSVPLLGAHGGAHGASTDRGGAVVDLGQGRLPHVHRG